MGYGLITVLSFLVMGVSTLFTVTILAAMQGQTPPDLLGKVMATVLATANWRPNPWDRQSMVCCLRDCGPHLGSDARGWASCGVPGSCAPGLYSGRWRKKRTAALVTLRSDKIPPGEVYRLLCVVNADAGPRHMEKGRRSSGGVVSPISSSRSQTKRLSPSREQPFSARVSARAWQSLPGPLRKFFL